ncbi:MAG: hypothetical protein JST46_18765 [Bacteroidetes bacterium]|nr:hypothetical protein [Bacteroidota bacterium]
MSLTSILSYNNKDFKGFRELLTESFPAPRIKFHQEIKVAPATTNYMLIGKAFDYLLRFHLEKEYGKKVSARKWVAESALTYFNDRNNGLIHSRGDELSDLTYDELRKLFDDKEERDKLRNQKVKEKFVECQKIHQQFIESKLKNETDLIESALFLARLDDVIRAGPMMKEYINFLPENHLDIDDLKQLTQTCDLEVFKPMKKIILNPTFGEGSNLVGGADADMIVDDMLIDIKVTKELKLTRPHFNQVLGYYLLFLIGGVDNHKDTKIKTLGLYFARHHVLWTIKIDDIANNDEFNKVKDFLKKKVKKTYRQQIA